ncbi:YdiK family protein [Halobacillus litoralis]|uniref:YdiK family protein n=1 Tax=Halobacillus litoralis TaxID=45668 RepID=UPI001CFE5F30|nr:YdiK family protein [Halobacillus litoralis]WLR48150.1 YdiK family protein [Halobacillus litoralis]
MRTSPLFMAFLYMMMGVAFTYIAAQSAEETVWNAMTIILAIVATFNIAVAIRLINLHNKIKNSKKK